MHHLTRARDVGYARELDPLDMTNDGDPRLAHLHGRQSHTLL